SHRLISFANSRNPLLISSGTTAAVQPSRPATTACLRVEILRKSCTPDDRLSVRLRLRDLIGGSSMTNGWDGYMGTIPKSTATAHHRRCKNVVRSRIIWRLIVD